MTGIATSTPPRAEGVEAAEGYGGTGAPGTRLLAGPPPWLGAESLDDHVSRLGSLAAARSGTELIGAVEQSGLGGRGGAGFPTARKMRAVAGGKGPAVVVVNASESEPASNKDRVLIRFRPHLVLDGAVLAAGAVGATDVVVHTHRTDHAVVAALRAAMAERASRENDPVPVHLSVGPNRFVAGESSAVIAFVEGKPARPRPGRRATASGVHGRPTLLNNAETVAHIALIARFGAGWFRSAGSATAPGSFLVTMAGEVARPGTVFEVWGPTSIGQLVAASGRAGLAGHGFPAAADGAALLVGGYGGAWVEMNRAWPLALSGDALACAGVALGCGLLGVLSPGRCGLAETAGLLDYLAAESAGQCGPCAFGLPELAAVAGVLARGRAPRSVVRRLLRCAATVVGRGGCAHPDGAVRLLESSLEVFAADVRYHLRHGPCPGASRSAVFPVSHSAEGWR